ncbi:beta strand repeat-containing protein [Novosphingobium lindaniclasticum]|uniref:Chitin-binding type-3 domain-containing protein n=1 Tax=Novosphingobium lindaniclasticum LE124 TaxID=1096930 RepID=T0IDG9_9SPHN|nr:hypothetical protein [Novosphingobium lindaniclasticum]EQB09705.1 hypothetical protein L284_19065 [Novosphingobium lindaniclasticum LE124]
MRVVLDSGETLDLGETEATPTIGIVDYSRRVTDDYGVTTVVERGFARRMSVRLVVPFDQTDALQASLAAIRAKPARWIADEGVDWLDFRGFFKDFEIDLPVPPKAYCTLTVEALTATEAFADPGGDPAPLGHASTLQLLQPAAIEGGALVAASVPENDYPEWAAGTTYPLGARVIKAATHRIYESGAIGNKGNDPAGVSGKWRDIGPTNRWAMFDQALGSTTEAPGQIAVTLAAGAIDAAALLDVKAATVRVQAAGYDRTVAPNAAGTVTFLDLPGTAGQVTVTVTGPGTVEVGTLLVGKLVGLGSTTDDAKAGITDFSRKEADEFGDIQIVERAWAKRMTLPAKLRRDAIDLVAGRIAAVRAKPSLWIGKEGMETLTVYGFFKDFSIAVDSTICTLSLSIEGLSTAGKVEPLAASVDWPDVGDPAGTKPEDNATVGAPAGTDVAGKPAEEVVGQLEEQEQQLDQLDIDVAQATINIAAAQATIVQMQTVAAETKAELEADIASINATADQIQADAAVTRASLATAQADIIAAGGRIDTIETTLGDQNASITSLAQTVSNHTGRLASIDTTLTANGASINQNAQAISAVQGDLASLSSTVSTQGASISQNAQAITTANQNIASLTTRVGTAESSISQNATAISGVSGRTATLESTVSAQGASISSLQSTTSAQGGDIATLRTQIVAGGGNLLVNTDLAAGTSAWNFYAVDQIATGSRNAPDSNWQIIGENNLTSYQGTSSSSGYCDWTQAVSVKGGNWYDASVLAATNRCLVQLIVQWLNVSGNSIGVPQTPTTAAGGGGMYVDRYQLLSVKAQAPAEAVRAVFYLRKLATNVGADSWAWFCRPQFADTREVSASPLPYSPGSARSVIEIHATSLSSLNGQYASLSSTVSTQGSTIASQATAISTLQGNYSNLSSTVSAQGSSITSAQSAISTLQAQTATLTTRVASGSQNLLANGGPDNGTTGWYSDGALTSDFSSSFGRYLRVVSSASSFFLNSASVPADAGGYYTAAVDTLLSASAGAMRMSLVFINSSGSEIGRVLGAERGGHSFDNANQGRALNAATGQAPNGTTAIIVQISWYGISGLSLTGARLVKLENYASWTPYSAEASITQSFQALSTLTTQYASLSTTVSTQGVTVSQHSTAITTINNNITSIMGRWGVEIDASGYVSGIALNNNGARADFAIRADRFKMVPPGGNGSDGKYIVVDGNGRTTDYILYQGVRVVEMGWRD